MFDWVKFEGHTYQSKDTPAQALDNYEVKDNELWYEDYDAVWINEKDAFLGGYLHKENVQWRKCDKFTGEVKIYRCADDPDDSEKGCQDWDEWSLYFINGDLMHKVPLKQEA